MAVFLDDKGREWTLRFDHALMLSIRKRLGVDLHNMTEQAKALDRMADDAALFVNMLYMLCEEQCQQQGITDEDFGRGLAEGETTARAILAIQEAILSFTTPQRREIARKMIGATLGARQRAEEMVGNLVTKALAETTCGL